MQALKDKRMTKFLNFVWQYFSFSDVTKIMKELGNRPARRKDLNSIDYINRVIEKKDIYPEFNHALLDLRKSPFKAVMKYEKNTLLSMFIIHTSDVIISLFSAIISIQILRTFESENKSFKIIELFFTNPSYFHKINFVIILAIFIFILNMISASLHSQKIEKEMFISWRIQAKLVLYSYNLLLNISRKSRTKYQSGDITNTVQNDTRFLSDFFSHACVDFPVLVVSSILVLSIMYAIIGNVAWLGFLMVFLQLPISLFLSWLGNILHKELMLRNDKRIHLISEWIQGMRLIRYFGWGKHFQDEINNAAKSEFYQGFKITTKYSFAFAITMNWWMVVSSAIFAGILYFNGQKDASTIFAAIWLSAILGNQITPLPWFVNIFSQAIVGSGRLRKFFKSKTQEESFNFHNIQSFSKDENDFINYIISGDKLVNFSVSFSLENVSLRFSDKEPWVLKDISLEIEPRKSIAIIGPVGSGKSLLIQMIMGEIPPNKGKVFLNLFDHENKNKVKVNIFSPMGLKILRSIQSYVPQEAFIFSATIGENVPISYNENFNKEERNSIMNALYAASMGHDLEKFEHNIDSEIGEKGVNLSGGQKQRLNLARSAFTSSSVIFLDDPLSALDIATEEELVKSIFSSEWGENKTIIWATHRLNFVSCVDKIIFIEEGEIVEEGKYADLMNNKYSKLYQLIVGDM